MKLTVYYTLRENRVSVCQMGNVNIAKNYSLDDYFFPDSNAIGLHKRLLGMIMYCIDNKLPVSLHIAQLYIEEYHKKSSIDRVKLFLSVDLKRINEVAPEVYDTKYSNCASRLLTQIWQNN